MSLLLPTLFHKKILNIGVGNTPGTHCKINAMVKVFAITFAYKTTGCIMNEIGRPVTA